MNILLVGDESAGAQTLKLLANGYRHLAGVATSPTRKTAGLLAVWRRAEFIGQIGAGSHQSSATTVNEKRNGVNERKGVSAR